MKVDFVGNAIRGYTFLITLFILALRAKPNFPLPFTWIFRDFKLFIFDPYSLNIFRKFLEEKEPERITQLDELMIAIISKGGSNFMNTSDMLRISTGERLSRTNIETSYSSKKAIFATCIDLLTPAFSRFKRTRAFDRLYERVKQFEDISIKAYE